ncbi:hypothetical protein GIX45_25155 [Erwinia sp. CPCC 100877]|nr:hypothetical protein [Erwinia sp. CPCC 100877]
MKENAQNYDSEKEAGQAVIKALEEKYHKQFTLVGGGVRETSKDVEVYKTKVQDEQGLEAEVTLPKDKKIGVKDVLNSGVNGISDTYSHVFYTKKAREAIEPLLKKEPFEKYYISLANAGLAKADLSLSADEYFQKTGDEYDLSIILPDNHNAEYYAKMIYPFYQTLITKQSNPFGMSIYANQLEIYTVGFVSSKGFDAEVTYEEMLEDVRDGMNGALPQPEEKWLRSEYYNGNS